ncbi:hypothetical protein RUND412_008354 [Rhizina undulata]
MIQPDSFEFEIDLAREAVGDASRDTADVSEEIAINTTEEAETEISRIVIQQPDPFDSELDSTVGRRSPTPTSDLGSGASTPVPLAIKTEQEIQIDELDRMEDVACKLSESLGGSVTALSMLKGVLEARKILMGEEHVRTYKIMGNLGYWCRQYGWDDEGMELLQITADGLKRVLGDRNEDTLYAIYKLAEAKLSKDYIEAWWLFYEVLEGQVEVLGKKHQEILDTMKRLEGIYSFHYFSLFHLDDEVLKLSESLVKCQIQVRGEDHKYTVVAMDLLVYHHTTFWAEADKHRISVGFPYMKAQACLQSIVNRRIPPLAEEDGNREAQFVFGNIHAGAYGQYGLNPFARSYDA